MVFLCGKKQLTQRAGVNSTPNKSGDYILENSFPVSTKKQKTKCEVASRPLITFLRMFDDTIFKFHSLGLSPEKDCYVTQKNLIYASKCLIIHFHSFSKKHSLFKSRFRSGVWWKINKFFHAIRLSMLRGGSGGHRETTNVSGEITGNSLFAQGLWPWPK